MIDTRDGKENFITIFSKLQTSQLKFFSKSCSSLTFTYVSFYQKTTVFSLKKFKENPLK